MIRSLLLFLLSFLAFTLSSQITLEKDINQGPADSDIRFSAQIGDFIYFTATDGHYGLEMYKWDLLSDQMTRLTDINQYEENSSPYATMEYMDLVFFTSNSDLYVYDPLLDEVKTFNSKFGASLLDGEAKMVFENKLFISGKQSSLENTELFVFDMNTGLTTEYVLAEGALNSFPGNFHIHNDELYFAAADVDGPSIYSWDKSMQIPYKLELATGDFGGNIKHIKGEGDRLYYYARTTETGDEVHFYDLVTKEANIFLDIYTGLASSKPVLIDIIDNQLYVIARDLGTQRRLWKIDLETKAIVGFDVNDDPSHETYAVISTSEGMFLNSFTTEFERDIWHFDLQTEEFTLVHDFANIPAQYLGEMHLFNGEDLVFSSRTTSYGLEWGKIDIQTSEITEPVLDINKMTVGSDPVYFEEHEGSLFFRALDFQTGAELYEYDPASGKTELIVDLNPGTSASRPSYLTSYGSHLYFSAVFPSAGEELVKYSKSTNEITLIQDTYVGNSGGQPLDINPIDGKVYSSINSQEFGREIFVYDTLTQQMNIEFELVEGEEEGGLDEVYAFQNKLYFNDYDTEIAYQYDPATGELVNFTSMLGIEEGSSIYFDIDDEENLYFINRPPGGKSMLNQWNPTTNIHTEFQNPDTYSSHGDYEVFQGKLYGSCQLSQGGRQLWSFEETEEFLQLTDISKLAPEYIVGFDTLVFFSGETEEFGRELWVYNPTLDTAYIYADIWEGPFSSNPEYLYVFNDKLYFAANNGVVGAELWSVASCINLFVQTVGSDEGTNNGIINLTIEGGMEPYEILWDTGSTDEDLTNLLPGKYVVTVKDASGCIATLVAEIDEIVNNKELESSRFKFYPNPALSQLTLESEKGGLLKIYDQLGRLTREIVLEPETTKTIDISDLVTGVYYLSIDGQKKLLIVQ